MAFLLLQAQIIPELESLMSLFQSSLKAIDQVADDFKKTLALDSLSSQLDLKFSQLELASGASGTSKTLMGASKKADVMKTLSMDAVQQDLQKQIEESYDLTFQQIKSVVKMKTMYFKNLKFKS